MSGTYLRVVALCAAVLVLGGLGDRMQDAHAQAVDWYEVTPTEGPVGSAVTVFANDDCDYSDADADYTLFFADAIVGQGLASAACDISVPFNVPPSPPGPVPVELCIWEGNPGLYEVCEDLGMFTVTQDGVSEESISLSPTSGPVGRNVTATVTGWTPNTDVTIWFFLQTVGQGVANSDGIAVIQFTVPTWAIVGFDNFVEACSHPVECQETLADDYADADFFVTEPPTVPPTTPPTVPPTVPPTTMPEPEIVPIVLPEEADIRFVPLICAEVESALQVLDSDKPNAVFVTHGWNGFGVGEDANHPEFEQMAQLIRSYLNTTAAQDEWEVINFRWNVLAEGWLNYFPHGALANAKKVGKCVGEALDAKAYEHVHFVGFSAGGALIDAASREMNGPTLHLTFLDAYTPHSESFVFGSEADLAEHYLRRDFSLDRFPLGTIESLNAPFLHPTDLPISAACNIDLSKRSVPAGVQTQHGGPIAFYRNTVPSFSPIPPGLAGSWGFGRSKEVMGDDWRTDCAPAAKDGQLRALLDNGELEPSFLDQLKKRVKDSLPWNLFRRTSATGTLTEIDENTWTMRTGSPVEVTATVTTAVDDEFLTFDYRFLTAPGGSGYLTVFLEGQRIFVADEQLDGGASINTDAIPLPPGVAPGSHELVFLLEPLSGSPSEIEISNVQFGGFIRDDQPPTTTTTPPTPTTPAAGITPKPDAPKPPDTGSGTAPLVEQPMVGGAVLFFLSIAALVAGGRMAVRRPRGE